MEFLIGFGALSFAGWLTFLTWKVKSQKHEINGLKRNYAIALRELLKLGYGKEEGTKETEEAGNNSGH